jgi:integrase
MPTSHNSSKSANGNGSIFPQKTKNGEMRWKVQVTLGRDSTGRIRRTTRTVSSRRDAEKLLRQLLKKQDDGHLTQIRSDTVATLGKYWVREDRPSRVRPSTAAGYEDLLRRYVNPTIGNVRMVDLTAQHVEKMMQVLRHEGKAAVTINAARRVLSGLCVYAVRTGLIPYNPVSATQPMKRQPGDAKQVQKPWSIEETTAVLTHARTDDKMDCFLHIMLYCGLRPGEALGVRWCDIDFDRGLLHVTGTLRDERRITPEGVGVVRLVRNDPKTAHSRRALQIHPDVYGALERQLMRRDMWKTIEGSNWQESDYVHTTHLGTAIDPSNNRKYFYRFLKSIGTRRIRVHDLRHVVAVLALEGDVRIEEVSQALGHTRIDTTKQIYAGHVQRLNDRFTDGVGGLLSTAINKRNSQTVESKIEASDG